MKGYVARKGVRWYAVIYEGQDPITGRERRSWHPAGTVRAEAERLAGRLAREHDGRNDPARSMSFGAYLTARWLPGKRLVLADSHLRRLPPQRRMARLARARRHRPASNPPRPLEALYGETPEARRRSALAAHAPRLRSIPKVASSPPV